MSIDSYITLGVIGLTLFLFVKEYFSVDLVAIGIIVALVATGVISPSQGLAGFSNKATLTVAAMFVLSHSLIKTDVIEYVGPFLEKLLDKGYTIAILSLGLSVGVLSAFINNTPIVATFIPIINSASRRLNVSPSRFLIPLSYVAILGGTCTLVGTSTNLLVSGMASERGNEGFDMFTLAPFGLILFATGILYIVLVGRKLIPERTPSSELKTQEGTDRFLAEIQIRSKPEDESKTISEIFEEQDIEVRLLKRKGDIIEEPDPSEELTEDDSLVIEGDLSKIRELISDEYFSIVDSSESKEFPEEKTFLNEILLLPNSDIVNKKLKDVDFLDQYSAKVIAIRQHGKQQYVDLKKITLKPGDILVLLADEKGTAMLQNREGRQKAPFLSLRQRKVKSINPKKLITVAVTIIGVITLATTGLIPLVIAAFGGIVVLNVVRIINMSDAYRSIDWNVVFLLAGSLSLGKAMSESGLSDTLGAGLIEFMSADTAPMIIIGVFYLITSMLTETMSNNASAALMVPLGFSVAESLGINVTPILVTIAFAGSASFMTPIGYQTNTMIYSAGNYKFKDFGKVGTPLNLLFLLLASLLIPQIYPF